MTERPAYVTDTHSLLWYFHKPQRLGAAAADAFDQVAASEADLIVPVIVLAEIIYILQAGKVTADFDDMLTQLQMDPNVTIVPLALERVLDLRNLTEVPEMHDRLIAAEAQALDATLITRDEEIQAANVVPTVWEDPT